MTSTTFPRDDVRAALRRVQATLVDAAGADAVLEKSEVERALSTMGPTERAAIDAFVGELEKRVNGAPITVRDIERAILGAERVLVPTAQPVAAPVDVEDMKAAKTFGDSIVKLAQRLAGAPGTVLPPVDSAKYAGLSGRALLDALRADCVKHLEFSYGQARDVMFKSVDVENGAIRDRYRGRVVASTDRKELAAAGINTEHTHPQSEGVEGTPAKSDLHHLFPTDAEANAKRSSLPFGVVVGDVVWEKDGAKLGKDEEGELVFEPPADHKGDVARALFYVAAVYGLPIPPSEERVLRRWHADDPPDAREKARNDAISAHQENRNPFVDDPSLTERIEDF